MFAFWKTRLAVGRHGTLFAPIQNPTRLWRRPFKNVLGLPPFGWSTSFSCKKGCVSWRKTGSFGLSFWVCCCLRADRWLQAREQQVIKIDLPLVEKLVAQWEGQTERRPNARELDALIEGHIREEILVREAARLGLDDDDIIIRRRLAQKVEFMMADETVKDLPNREQLRRFFDENRAEYDTPETLSWRHVFVESEAQARQVQAVLNADESDWQNKGKPFMLNRQYARQSELELSRLMGTQFALALFRQKEQGLARASAIGFWLACGQKSIRAMQRSRRPLNP